MARLVFLAFVLLFVGLSAQELLRYDNHKVVKIIINDIKEFEMIQSLEEDFDEFDMWAARVGTLPGYVEMMVSPSKFDYFNSIAARFDLNVEVLVDNVQALYDIEREHILMKRNDPNASFFDSYKNYTEVMDFIDSLVTQYPTLARVEKVGTTYEGRDINAIIITNTDESGSNPPKIVYTGTMHAREWISPMTSVYIANALCANFTDGDEDVKKILNYFEYHIIPVVNGDGFVYTWTDNRNWRKNRHHYTGNTCTGVDLNRNWDFEFGVAGSSTNPCSDTYQGPSGFSEPETTNVSNYIKNLTNTVGYIDIHAYSELFMSSWGYTNAKPPSYTQDEVLMKNFTAAIKSDFGKNYEYGTIYDVIYPASGSSTDWVTNLGVNLSYATELRPASALGGGFALPADQIVPQGIEFMSGVISMALSVYTYTG